MNTLKKKVIIILSVYLLFQFFSLEKPLISETLFKNTDFELEVIRIKGDIKGPTLLIFGGIHGDEEGGYCSAEVLSNIKMKKGNLVIVPRVNFAGIMQHRREIYGDMNRKFTEKEYPNDPDHKIMLILKKLISEADIFINQHDAFGFHRKKYISKLYNPFRYGQSLIVDTGNISSSKLKTDINIAEIGKRIIKNVNSEIKNRKHHFCFWNQNSVSSNTQFKDMQKSATYYAVTKHSIPSFGLETSKHLPSSQLKIKMQILVIKKIMDEFGLKYILENDSYSKPVLYWIELIKNSKDIIRVNSSTNIRLNINDKIKLLKIHSNYKSGLSFDILGWKNLNDFHNEFIFKNEKTAFIRKNQTFIGQVRFKSSNKNSIQRIFFEINNKTNSIPNWGVIKIKQKDLLKITNCDNKKSKYVFDVRGLKNRKRNDANILISSKNLLKQYSFMKEGKIYFAKIYRRSSLAGGFQIEIID